MDKETLKIIDNITSRATEITNDCLALYQHLKKLDADKVFDDTDYFTKDAKGLTLQSKVRAYEAGNERRKSDLADSKYQWDMNPRNIDGWGYPKGNYYDWFCLGYQGKMFKSIL